LENQEHFKDEVHPSLLHNRFGLLSTSNKAPHMNNSNFFITLTDENLTKFNGQHTVFGQVVENLDTLHKVLNIFPQNWKPQINAAKK
jgi:peptidyl-prolyl cis-trans isomerase A (cyclophilin A)